MRVRPANKEDLAREKTPGKILFKDSRVLPMPAAPPRFAFNGIMLFDPLIGPKLATEECVKDGGDVGPRMGPGPNGTIGGQDPTDTGMMYTTRSGTKVVASNRVGLCVPRFAAARVETSAATHHTVIGPDAHHHVVMAKEVFVKIGTVDMGRPRATAGFIGSKRASASNPHGPGSGQAVVGRPAGWRASMERSYRAQHAGRITSFPERSLLLRKSIDPPHPETSATWSRSRFGSATRRRKR